MNAQLFINFWIDSVTVYRERAQTYYITSGCYFCPMDHLWRQAFRWQVSGGITAPYPPSPLWLGKAQDHRGLGIGYSCNMRTMMMSISMAQWHYILAHCIETVGVSVKMYWKMNEWEGGNSRLGSYRKKKLRNKEALELQCMWGRSLGECSNNVLMRLRQPSQ